jgi:hypothetical protein
MEISQLRSGWWRWMMNFRAGRHDGIGRMFSGVPSGHDFVGDAPDTLCLANFRLSLWDENCPAEIR